MEHDPNPDEPQRWIIQTFSDRRRAGRIARSSEESLDVDFGDEGVFTWEWNRLPKSAQVVAEGNVFLRALLQPDGLRQELEADPVNVVLEILRERGPLKAAEIKDLVASLDVGTALPAEWWKPVQAHLKRHDHVAASGTPAAYRWSAEPVQRPERETSPDEALEALASPGTDGKKRASLREALVSLDERGGLDHSRHAAAIALGVPLGGDTIEWARIEPETLRARSLEALVRAAPGAEAALFLVRTAIAPRSGQAADRAAQRLREVVSPARLEEELVAAADRWWELLDESGTDRFARIASQAGRWQALLPAPIPASLLRVPLRLLFAMGRLRATGKEAMEARDWAVSLLGTRGTTLEALRDAIVAEMASASEAKVLIAALRDAPLGPGTGRARILAAAAGTPLEPLVQASDAWSGLSLARLGDLVRAGELTDLLLAPPLLDTVVRPKVERAVEDVDERRLPALLALPGPLLELVPGSVFGKRFLSLAASDTAIGRLLGAATRSFVDEGRRIGRDQEAERVRADALATDEARRRSAELEAQLAAAADRQAGLERDLRAVLTSQRSSTEAELRVARFEGLRLATELLEEMRRLAAQPGAQQDQLQDAFDRARALAAPYGLAMLEQAGDVVAYDPDRHRTLLGDPTPTVRVVQPAWGVQTVDGLAVVCHGQVRPISTQPEIT